MAFGALIGLLGSLVFLGGHLESAERATLFARMHLRGAMKAPEDIVIVAVDERSLAEIGQFPWDRRWYAKLLSKLKVDGARAVAFDIAFAEKGSHSGEDEALGEALRAFPSVLAIYRYALGGTMQLETPLPNLMELAGGFGIAQFSSVQESPILTHIPMQRQGNRVFPTMSLAMARLAGAQVSDQKTSLNYLGPTHSFRWIPFADALRLPNGAFKGKYVLVGATAAGLPDTGYHGPFAERGPLPGIEMHATALENLLYGHGLIRLPKPLSAGVMLLLSMLGAPWLLNPRLGHPWRRAAILSALVMLWSGFAYFALLRFYWVELVPVLLVLGVSFVIGLLWEENTLIRDRNQALEWYAHELEREAKRQRERIDGELHDGVQQLIIALIRDLRRAPKLLEKGPERLLDKLSNLALVGDEMLAEILRLRRDLTPHTLAQSGLMAALEELISSLSQREGIQGTLEVIRWEESRGSALEGEVYWLIRECLNNAIKHSEASLLTVRLDGDSIQVIDNGKGFEVPDLSRPPESVFHSGLYRLTMRAKSLGGEMIIHSTPGEGTTVTLKIQRRNP